MFQLIHGLVDRIMEVIGAPFVSVGDETGYYIKCSDVSGSFHVYAIFCREDYKLETENWLCFLAYSHVLFICPAEPGVPYWQTSSYHL